MAIRVCKKHGKLYGEFIEVEFDDRVHGDKCPLCGSVSPMNELWKWITDGAKNTEQANQPDRLDKQN